MERLVFIVSMSAVAMVFTMLGAPSVVAKEATTVVGNTQANDPMKMPHVLPPYHLVAADTDDFEIKRYTVNKKSQKEESSSPRLLKSTKERHEAVVGDRINQGQDAPKDKYGYFVALVLDNEFSNFFDMLCGGSLLSPLFVLTAAHCVSDVNGHLLDHLDDATIGFFGPERVGQRTTQRIRARRYFVHKRFDWTFLRFDLAVIELEKPTFDFEPILPDLGNIALKLGDHVTAIGLGRVEDNLLTSQLPKLQEKRVNFMPTSLCNGWWMTFFRSTSPNGVLCTYADFFAGGLCVGDSGSPIIKVAEKDDGVDTVIGVVSFGYPETGCSANINRTLPDGHAKVSEGRDELWGPLVCNSSSIREHATSMEGPLQRQLRPLWCDGQEFATVPPPHPIANTSSSSNFDGFRGANKRYPYFVGVQYRNNLLRSERFECMGTLIHPNFVLTMGECVQPKFGDFFEVSQVRVGMNCLWGSNCSGRRTYHDRKGAQKIVHPHLHADGLWEMYNVGLIRLDRPVPTNFIKRFPVLDNGKIYRKTNRKDRNGTKEENTVVWALGIGRRTHHVYIELSFLHEFETRLVEDWSCNTTIKTFFERKYGLDVNRTTRIPDGLFGCANRSTVMCSSPYLSNPDNLVEWGSPLIVSQRKKGNGSRRKVKRDVLLGTLNFRTDMECRRRPSPDVYNRVSAYREWIQCVICVGSINATFGVPPRANLLCAGTAPQQRDCDKYGISLGMYDEELLQRQQIDLKKEDDPERPQPTRTSEACRMGKAAERRNSTFQLNPFSGKMAKCAKIARNGLESLLCGESQLVLDARKNCPHMCGLCD